jgi:hypothetical protein
MKLNDEVIAHVAKILQMALITGTDIVDHMRMLVLTGEGNELFLDEEYLKNHAKNIDKMISDALEGVDDQQEGA